MGKSVEDNNLRRSSCQLHPAKSNLLATADFFPQPLSEPNDCVFTFPFSSKLNETSEPEQNSPSRSGLKRRLGRFSKYAQLLSTNNSQNELEDKFSLCMVHPDFWLEVVDKKHRYGYHLRLYREYWMQQSSNRDFFHWLDEGEGFQLDLPQCTYEQLNETRVQYCTEDERAEYEVSIAAVNDGHLQLKYTLSKELVQTCNNTKWIFVLDTNYKLYIAQKVKGYFHHSSFVSGRPIIAAGKMVVCDGIVETIEPHSGHFKPSLLHLNCLCEFLTDVNVDLSTISFRKPRKWQEEWPFPGAENETSGDSSQNFHYDNQDEEDS